MWGDSSGRTPIAPSVWQHSGPEDPSASSSYQQEVQNSYKSGQIHRAEEYGRSIVSQQQFSPCSRSTSVFRDVQHSYIYPTSEPILSFRRTAYNHDASQEASRDDKDAEQEAEGIISFHSIGRGGDRRLARHISQASPAGHKGKKCLMTGPSDDDMPTYEAARTAPPPILVPQPLLDPFLEPRTYNLIIRQSPIHGQLCTLGSKDRRILDPLPIIELDMRDRYGKRDYMGQASPFLLMQVTLIIVDVARSSSTSTAFYTSDEYTARAGSYALRESAAARNPSPSSRQALSQPQSGSIMSDHGATIQGSVRETAFPAMRMLEGKLMASAQIARNVDYPASHSPFASSSASSTTGSTGAAALSDEKSCFFVFSDLSIRIRGTFRLRFSLLRLGAGHYIDTREGQDQSGPFGSIVAQVTSEPFQVVHARDFAGMTESTPLAKTLASQGIHIPIRNETRGRQRATQSRGSGPGIPSS